MLFVSTHALRTISSTSDSSGSSDIPFIPNFVTNGMPLFDVSSTDGGFEIFQSSDDFSMTHQFPLRTISTLSVNELPTRDAPVVYSMLDNNLLFPAKRTVSKMARDHYVDDLDMSDNYSTACDDDSAADSPIFVDYTIDTASSNVVITASESKRAKRIHVVKRASVQQPRAAGVSGAPAPFVPQDLPKLHLGETGRCKLKSMISNLIKDDEDLRAQVLSISKVKLASIGQLLQMAYVCGLWEEATRIGEQFAATTQKF